MQVLEIIYGERPHLETNPEARGLLSRAPLVRCTDGVARPAEAVHSPNRALALISPNEPIADLAGLAPHLIDTLYWLGVSRNPESTACSHRRSSVWRPTRRIRPPTSCSPSLTPCPTRFPIRPNRARRTA